MNVDAVSYIASGCNSLPHLSLHSGYKGDKKSDNIFLISSITLSAIYTIFLGKL